MTRLRPAALAGHRSSATPGVKVSLGPETDSPSQTLQRQLAAFFLAALFA